MHYRNFWRIFIMIVLYFDIFWWKYKFNQCLVIFQINCLLPAFWFSTFWSCTKFKTNSSKPVSSQEALDKSNSEHEPVQFQMGFTSLSCIDTPLGSTFNWECLRLGQCSFGRWWGLFSGLKMIIKFGVLNCVSNHNIIRLPNDTLVLQRLTLTRNQWSRSRD